MNNRFLPWAVVAGVLMVGFLVWLGAQMSRTERADEVLVILVICFGLGALAMALGYGRRRRG